MRNIQLDHHTYFEQAYTFAPIGIALVSMDGTWIKVNPALCKIMGYSEKELLELTIRDITHPDDLQRTDDFIDELLDGGSSNREMEKRYVQKKRQRALDVPACFACSRRTAWNSPLFHFPYY